MAFIPRFTARFTRFALACERCRWLASRTRSTRFLRATAANHLWPRFRFDLFKDRAH
jgi:hypothetical protein